MIEIYLVTGEKILRVEFFGDKINKISDTKPGLKANYKIIDKKASRFVVKKLGGTKSITVADAFAACRGSKYFTNKFDVLYVLYALTGTKQGKISKIAGNKLHFNIWKGNQ